MNILVTPKKFGNVAALAMQEGVDVSTYLIRYARALSLFDKTEPLEVPGEEVIVDDDSLVLEDMFTSTSPEAEPADLPVSDFYKDIV